MATYETLESGGVAHLIEKIKECCEENDVAGPVGPAGPAGRGIKSVKRTAGTGQPGSTDTYTIEFTDGTDPTTFQVYNGKDGENGEDGGGSEKRGGVVGINAATTTKPWFKMASLESPNKDQNRNIVLLIHKINAPGDYCGILSVNVKTGASNQWVDGYCAWEYVGAGLDLNDFVYAYNPDGVGITELWVKCDGGWACYGYEVLYESIGATRNVVAFDLYNGRLTEGEATPTPGYTTKTSTINKLQGQGGGADIPNPLPVNQGGSGVQTLTSNEVLIGNGTNAIKTTSLGTGVLRRTTATSAPIFGTVQTADIAVSAVTSEKLASGLDGDMKKSVYDKKGKAQDVFEYVNNAIDGASIEFATEEDIQAVIESLKWGE